MEAHTTSDRSVYIFYYSLKSKNAMNSGARHIGTKLLLLYFVFLAGLDVVRTDRTLVFYEKQENLSKLWDILAVYAWVDTDTGYCQGENNSTKRKCLLIR